MDAFQAMSGQVSQLSYMLPPPPASSNSGVRANTAANIPIAQQQSAPAPSPFSASRGADITAVALISAADADKQQSVLALMSPEMSVGSAVMNLNSVSLPPQVRTNYADTRTVSYCNVASGAQTAILSSENPPILALCHPSVVQGYSSCCAAENPSRGLNTASKVSQ